MEQINPTQPIRLRCTNYLCQTVFPKDTEQLSTDPCPECGGKLDWEEVSIKTVKKKTKLAALPMFTLRLLPAQRSELRLAAKRVNMTMQDYVFSKVFGVEALAHFKQQLTNYIPEYRKSTRRCFKRK